MSLANIKNFVKHKSLLKESKFDGKCFAYTTSLGNIWRLINISFVDLVLQVYFLLHEIRIVAFVVVSKSTRDSCKREVCICDNY